MSRYIKSKYHKFKSKYNYKKKSYSKYIILVAVLLLIGGVAVAVSPYVESYMSHGVEGKLFVLFNEDRSVYGVSPLTWSNQLNAVARSRAREMAQADINGMPMPLRKDYLHEDVYVVSVDDFERRFYYSSQFVVDKWRNTDYRFRLNELDRDHVYVGIGSAKASNNYYYIVVEWSSGSSLYE